jgi:dihydropteroate synthase
MGILNLTPDSFSDGGEWNEPARAVDRALEMLESGADLIDLGAESTRPGGGVYGTGAASVAAGEELDRLLPVLEPLRSATDGALSVDTRKGEVAATALGAGADLINDVSCLRDPALADAVAAAGCPLILMHSRGEIRSMQERTAYGDLLSEIRAELEAAIARAVAAGVDRERILIDPGIGFAKQGRQNLALLRRLDAFEAIGRPLVVGASRKSFIAEISASGPGERMAGSLAAAAWAAHHRAAIVRVHDVAETVQFLDVWAAISDGGESRP